MQLCFPVMSPECDVKIMALGGDFDDNLFWLGQAGYQGIELMIQNPDEISVNDLKQKLKANQLTAAAVGVTPMVAGRGLTLANPDTQLRAQAMEEGKKAIDLAADLNALFGIGSFRGNVSDDEGNRKEDALSAFRELCGYAAEKGVCVVIEPQGKKNGNYLNTMNEVIQWVENIGLKNVGIILDMFHLYANEPDVNVSLQKGMDKIGLLHFCDSGRALMGHGEFNIRGILEQVQRSGFSGYISTEVKLLEDPILTAMYSYKYYEDLNQRFFNNELLTNKL